MMLVFAVRIRYESCEVHLAQKFMKNSSGGPPWCSAALLAFSLTCSTARAASPILITFNELSERPLEAVFLKEVTFRFNGSNADFPQGLFGTASPVEGATALMSAPWAAGSSDGTLTLNFATPVSELSFDAGLTTTAPLAEGFRVALYQNNELLTSIGVATAPNGPSPLQFSEAEFSYVSPAGPFTSAVITFSPHLNFAFDNLNYVLVPEPGSVALAAAALAIAALRRRPND
jgi:hypothetical protein